MAKNVNKVWKRIKTPKGTKLVLTEKSIRTNVTRGGNTNELPVKGNAAKLKWQQQQLNAEVKKNKMLNRTANVTTVATQTGQTVRDSVNAYSPNTKVEDAVKQNTNGGLDNSNSPSRNEDESNDNDTPWIL